MKKLFLPFMMTLIGLSLTFLISCDKDKDEPEPENSIPTAAFTSDTTNIKLGDAIQFTDASTDEDGTIAAWAWDFGDGNSSTEQSPSYTYTAVGSYTVSLVVTDDKGGKSENSATVSISVGKPEPTVLWSYALPDVVDRTGPAIADDGTIFIACKLDDRQSADNLASADPNFFAVNPDGSMKWGVSIAEGDFTKPDAIISSPSIASDGSVYMQGQFSRIIFHIAAATGDTIATRYLNTRQRYQSPVITADGDVIVGGYSKGDKGLRSLSSDLSTRNWLFEAGNEFNSTPAIGSDGTIYAASTNGNIYAINSSDGTEKWNATYGSWVASAIALSSDGTVYLSAKLNDTPDGILKAYNAADGTEKWSVTFPAENAEQGGPAIAADGTVYLGNAGGKMQAFNPADGTILWTYTASAGIEVVPAIDNSGNIYFGDTGGMFYVLKSDGSEAYVPISLGDKINSSVAIGSDGRIYVGSSEGAVGKLNALKTSATGLASDGWPMYAKNAKHTGR